MTTDRILYYARRIADVTPIEAYRKASVWLRRRHERRNLEALKERYSIERLLESRGQWLDIPAGESITEPFNDSLRRRLPLGGLHETSFWRDFVETYPEAAEDITTRADRILEGRIRLFQWKEVLISRPFRWSATFDESSPDEDWPSGYHPDIRFHHDPYHPERDVKWSWELNRFQHLPVLGAAWRITGDERYSREASDQLESWMSTVRYPFGVQWSSNLEVALRALAFMRCHAVCMDAPGWDEGFMDRFVPCLYLHVLVLERELSLFHALSNHILGEAAALLHMSLLYPVFSDSSRRRDLSMGVLKDVVPKLILPDGVYAEQTTGYARFVAEFLLPVLHAASWNNFVPARSIVPRLKACIAFLKSLSPDPKRIPMIGDSDTGSAIGWGLADYWDFRPIFASSAVLLGDPKHAEGIDGFPAESFLILGSEGRATFDALKAPSEETGPESGVPSGKLTVYPRGGYQVSRDRDFHLVFDAGPLGLPPRYGHGHSDGLSFILYYNNMPAVADPGTYAYNGPRMWRDCFRSTSAHNTVCVDDGDQSPALGGFVWALPLDIETYRPVETDSWRLLGGRIRVLGVVHERLAAHLPEGGVIIRDRVTGKGRHRLQWSLHWSPEWELKETEEGRILARSNSGELETAVLKPRGVSLKSAKGSLDPITGWHSRFYGHKVPSYTVRLDMEVALPAGFVTVLKRAGVDLTIPDDLAARLGLDDE
ncbi:MAG: alginate lyase family protein [Pseudomonadota bacterium]